MAQTGRLAVVTGAAGGIGSAITETLQSDGFTVIGVDVVASSPADEHLQIDLGDEAASASIGDSVGDRPLSGLVNNAAVSSTKTTESVTPPDWDRILHVNLRAPFFLAERLSRNLAAGQGAVVNIASVHAFATSPGAVPYAASKGGLVALTRAQAIDWASRGLPIRANAIAPGAVDTPMLQGGLERTGLDQAELARRHPSGRVGIPGDVAAAVAWLLSAESGFVNGATIPVDGGALAQLGTEPTSFRLPSEHRSGEAGSGSTAMGDLAP